MTGFLSAPWGRLFFAGLFVCGLAVCLFGIVAAGAGIPDDPADYSWRDVPFMAAVVACLLGAVGCLLAAILVVARVA